jgi:hypothetical protein
VLVHTSVMLDSVSLLYLDMLRVRIRATHGRAIDRSALLRAITRAVEQSEIDLSEAPSEDEITARLVRRLRG